MRALIVTLAFLLPLTALAEPREWAFRVYLDDREIGTHTFTLVASDDREELRSEARFDVRILFIDALTYRHEAIETWRGNCLQSLAAHTRTNEEEAVVNAQAGQGYLVVDRDQGRERHDGCVMSFAYWNPRILTADRLLNSQTGELLPVRITPQGEETIAVRGRPINAQRHRLSAGKLTIDLWYAGHEWVALESPAVGGRRLRYELI
jgi:hypothetical protein